MFLPKPIKKLTIDSKYTPTLSFLSPASKYNQRSFSTSSLAHNYTSLNPINNSLKDQIRLQSFKRNVLNDSMSKLNKSALHRANLKVQSIEYCREQDMKKEFYELQRQIKMLQQQNKLLIQQRNQDLLLISRQNQIIVRMEQQLKQPIYISQKRQNSCRCDLTDQCLDKIQFLQDQIRHLQQEKKQFKEQIHSLIVKQEQLKATFYNNNKLLKQDRKQLNKAQQIVPKEQKKKKKKKEEAVEERLQQTQKDSGVQRYLQYLKNVRNRQIDHIQSILNND